jgi:hypothetical protein
MSANEAYELRPSVPIIRVFRARARRGCERALADKLATSSVEVVQGQPGFLGYLAGGPANESQREFIFASTGTPIPPPVAILLTLPLGNAVTKDHIDAVR